MCHLSVFQTPHQRSTKHTQHPLLFRVYCIYLYNIYIVYVPGMCVLVIYMWYKDQF